MTVRERERSGTLTDFSVFFQLMLTYRVPMKVEDATIFPHFTMDTIYYHCPRCQNLLDREFMVFCDRCGQCLDWSCYRNAKRTRIQHR